jgi:hypothetical protein
VKIAGYEVAGGDAYVVRLVAAAMEPKIVVASTGILPGPFVVAAVRWVGPGFPGGGMVVTVVGSPIQGEWRSAQPAQVQGVPVVERAPVINVAGHPAMGDPLLYLGRTYVWPWYVFEGRQGAVAVWGLINGTELVVDARAVVSVWQLRAASARPVVGV